MKIHHRPGYVPSLKWILVFDPERFVKIPSVKDEADVKQLFNTLYEPVRAFPYASALDRLAMLGALFTAVLRPAMETAPILAFDAPVQGSGKTLLAQVVSILRSGAQAPATTLANYQNREDELRKTIGAQLSTSNPILLLDNITGRLNSPTLAALTTTCRYSTRKLGESVNIESEPRLLTILTGNNLMLTDDLPRRTLQVRVDPKTDKPYALKYDFEPTKVALAKRDEIILAILGLIQHWIEADCPTTCDRAPLGSFEQWDQLVAQPIAWLVQQYPDVFNLNESDLIVAFDQRVDEDDSKDALARLIDGLYRTFLDRPFKAGDVNSLVKYAEHEEENSFSNRVADGLEGLDGQRPTSATKLGRRLKYLVGRKVGGARIIKIGNRAGSATFKIDGIPQWAIHKASTQPGQWTSADAKNTFIFGMVTSA